MALTNKWTTRLLALSLGIAIAAVLGAGATLALPSWGHAPTPRFPGGQGCPPTDQGTLDEEAPIRHGQVLAELADLADHPWAGAYRTTNKWPLRLLIAPGAGLTLYQESWCGTCTGWRGLGEVLEAQGTRVRFRLELGCGGRTESGARWWCRDETLDFVRWGQLVFAVPASQLEGFYVTVNDGYSFPAVPVRLVGDGEDSDFDLESPLRPPGRPEIVAGYSYLLLDEPVRCRVLALEDWRPRAEPELGRPRYHDAVYRIGAGSRRGLAVGMHMYIEGPVPLDRRRKTSIVHVEAETALVLLPALTIDRHQAETAIGNPISSLHPEAPRRDG